MSDEHPGNGPDDTAPLSAGQPYQQPPDPRADQQPEQGEGWLPPRTQPPPYQWNPPGPDTPGALGQSGGSSSYESVGMGPSYPPPGAQTTLAMPSSSEPGRRAKAPVSGWVWPLVTVVALVVGVLGGVAGGALYGDLNGGSDSSDAASSQGLPQQGTTPKPLPVGNRSVAAVAQQLLPSTIQVLAQYHGKKDGATGSGFALDGSGHYITNNHVVADAATHDGPIEIMDQKGEKFDATVVGRSPTYDLAVLSVDGGPQLPAAALGSAAALHVGDQVVAFGSPLGLSSTVTSGIVSALNRPVTTSDTGASSFINAVQTDAAINPGNSGGPLVDLAGQVVGVNSAIATTGSSGTGQSGNIGVGFAIPIDQVKITADQILRTGRARYPVIGATVNTAESTDAGAEIISVKSGSPAEDSGLHKGDVVTQVGDEHVSDGIALIVAIRSHQPGESVPFLVTRDDHEVKLTITLGSEVG